MPSNYTGNDAGLAARDAVQIPCPVDGDPRNAASVNAPLQKLANFIQYLQGKALLMGAALSNPDTLRLNPVGWLTAGLLLDSPLIARITTTANIRIYRDGGTLYLTSNVTYDGSSWKLDQAGTGLRVMFTGTAFFVHVAASGAAGSTITWGAATVSIGDRLGLKFLNSSATPGNFNATGYSCGRGAIAAGQSACTVTWTNLQAGDVVLVSYAGATEDSTLNRLRVETALHSFTVRGNANATAAVQFNWVVIKGEN